MMDAIRELNTDELESIGAGCPGCCDNSCGECLSAALPQFINGDFFALGCTMADLKL